MVNYSAYFRNRAMEVAILFTFKGKISPNRAKVTGPTPSPYPIEEQITHTGIKISLISMNVSFSNF